MGSEWFGKKHRNRLQHFHIDSEYYKCKWSNRIREDIHGLDMAHIAGEGTVAEEGIVVLIRMWDWESWNISTWVAQIPILFVQLLSNFLKGLHCHTPYNKQSLKVFPFWISLKLYCTRKQNKKKLKRPNTLISWKRHGLCFKCDLCHAYDHHEKDDHLHWTVPIHSYHLSSPPTSHSLSYSWTMPSFLYDHPWNFHGRLNYFLVVKQALVYNLWVED